MAFMNGRMVVFGSAALALSSLVGCGNAPVTCGAGQVLNDAGTCVAEVVTPPPAPPVVNYFKPVYFAADGIFGYNPTWDSTFPVKAVDQSGSEVVINPLVTVTLAEESYLTAGNDSAACKVQFVPAGNPDAADGNMGLATWAVEAGVDFAFEVAADVQPMDNCGDKNFDVAIWGDNVAANVATHTWGLGVMLAINAEVESGMATAYAGSQDVNYATDIKPFLLGGGFYSELLVGGQDSPKGFFGKGYAFAIELDANNVLVTDGQRDKWIPIDNMSDDGTSVAAGATPALVKAAYQISSAYMMGGADTIFIKQ